MATSRALLVGQCSFDAPAIISRLKEAFDVSVGTADSADEAVDLLSDASFDLVMINRILDATGEDGTALLREMKQRTPETPMMLVSNFDDAHERAVKAGGVCGFGKSDLGANGMLSVVAPYLTAADGP